VYRASLPASDRLSVEDLVEDLAAAGRHARVADGVDAIVDLVAAEARSGDVIVAMSNGAFGGIHEKLLAGLAARAAGR